MDFSAVAHDLRTPLHVMLGHMQLLAAERLSDAGRQRLDRIEAQINRMMRLLDTCFGQATRQPSFAPVDLRATIRSVVAELDVMLARRGIEIVTSADDVLPLVLGDADALYRVLLNLLTNAADAISHQGCICIRARVRQPARTVSTIDIDISDSGSGIPAHVIARVFDDGFTTKSSGQTHGLGLGICREILHKHGGTIELRSEPGRGTTARLSIPTSVSFDA